MKVTLSENFPGSVWVLFHLICSCSYSANTFFNIEIGSLDFPFSFLWTSDHISRWRLLLQQKLSLWYWRGDKNTMVDLLSNNIIFLPRVTVTPIVTALVMLIQNDFNFWNFRWPQMRKWQLQQALNWFWLHRWLLSTRWWIWSIIFRTSSVFYIMR